jgi:type I restriction enzyme, S subunit
MSSHSNDISDGFRITELGPLPEDWQVVSLRDVFIEVDRRVANYRDINADRFPVLSLTKNYGLMLQSERFGKRIALEDVSDYKVVKRGEIVYNPYVIWEGAIHILDRFDYGLVSPVYPVVETNLELADPYFLDLILRTPLAIAAYNRFAAGAVNRRRSIRKTDFMAIQVPLPPLPEQKAIARVLSTIQKAVEAQDKIIAAARELKKSLMRHLFTYGPVPVSEAERVLLKETEIGLMPEQWEVKCLVDTATLQRGKDLPKQHQILGQYPIVGSSGIIGYHNEFVCSGPGVVTGRSGSIGNLAYVEENYWPHNTGLYVKDFHGNNPKFIYYLLHLVDFHKYATGVSVPTLNRNFVHSALVPVPSLPEQKEITHMLSAVDKKIDTEVKRKTVLQTLFKTMLHLLMTGKVRVKEMEAQVS